MGAILSSLLYILAFPNFNLSYLAWVALVPLTLAASRNPPARAFQMGWLAGTLAYTGILYWIVGTFQAAHLSIWLTCICLLLLSAYLGVYWGAWAAFIAAITLPFEKGTSGGILTTANLPPSPFAKGGKILWPILCAAAWIALEFLRAYLFSGFPWTLLGDSQWQHQALIQIASITGVYGVSFLIVLVNVTLAGSFLTLHYLPLSLAGEGGSEGGSSNKGLLWRTLTQPSVTLSRLGRGLLLPIFLLTVIYLYGHHRIARYHEADPNTHPIHAPCPSLGLSRKRIASSIGNGFLILP